MSQLNGQLSEFYSTHCHYHQPTHRQLCPPSSVLSGSDQKNSSQKYINTKLDKSEMPQLNGQLAEFYTNKRPLPPTHRQVQSLSSKFCSVWI